MSQVDYTYYIGSYGGDLLTDPGLFTRMMRKAEVYLHLFTFDRLKGEPYSDLVKDCLCDMAEALCRYNDQDGSREIKSENNDGYSVSYVTERVDGQSIDAMVQSKLYSVASRYLMNTGFLNFDVC